MERSGAEPPPGAQPAWMFPRASAARGASLAWRLHSGDEKALGKKKIYRWLGLEVSWRRFRGSSPGWLVAGIYVSHGAYLSDHV